MKKWIASGLGLMMLSTTFVACGGEEQKTPSGGETYVPEEIHICSFTQQNTDEAYLKREATTSSPALYYYSCECGKKDDDFFAYRPMGIVDEGYIRYDVATTALKNKTIGYGAQIDTDTFMPWNNPLGGGLTADEEAMFKQRVADMNLQYTRVKFFPEYFERANDNDDPNSFDAEASGADFECAEMQALYKVLDICEENGVKVDLSWNGCNTWFHSFDGKYTFTKEGDTCVGGTWLGYNTSQYWTTAPRMEEGFDGYAEYAENISVMLDYLINVKEYTCIYGFSVIEELFYDKSDTRDWEEYVKCCKVIQDRLIKDGLRDKLQFIGTTPQYTASQGTAKAFAEGQEPLKDVYDICGMPNYRFNNKTSGIVNFFKGIMEKCEEIDKGLVISEFCQGGVGSASPFLDAVNKTDIDDYDAGLYISRFMIASADNGVGALNHYILGDTWFNGRADYTYTDGDEDRYYHKCDDVCKNNCTVKWDNSDGYIHTMGLWQYRDNAWKAHPEYYFWSLICRYTDSGSEIYRIRKEGETKMKEDVMLVSFRLPDGSWSYMIANNTTETQKIAIVNENADSLVSFKKYVVTEAGIPEDRAVVLPSASGTVDATTGVAHVELAPKSFTVLSNKA